MKRTLPPTLKPAPKQGTVYERFFLSADAALAFVLESGVNAHALDDMSTPFQAAHKLTYSGARTVAARPRYKRRLCMSEPRTWA